MQHEPATDEPRMTVRVTIYDAHHEVSALMDAPCTASEWEEMGDVRRAAVRDKVINNAVADVFDTEMEINACLRGDN